MCSYLKTARERLNSQLDGIKLDPEDVYAMQMMCAYEVCSLSVQAHESCLPTNDAARLLLSGIPNSANSSPSKSGKDLITRKDYEQIHFLTAR
jgi:hypothetical protein